MMDVLASQSRNDGSDDTTVMRRAGRQAPNGHDRDPREDMGCHTLKYSPRPRGWLFGWEQPELEAAKA